MYLLIEVHCLPPQIASQSPRCGRSDSLVEEKHSSCISVGMSFRSSWLTVSTKLGPGHFVTVEKSTPKEAPRAKAAATNATPIEVEAWIDVVEGIRAALK